MAIKPSLFRRQPERIVHVLCWVIYAYIAIWGRGDYWKGVGAVNTFMFFAAFPIAFFTNAFGLMPGFFQPRKWFWYGLLLLLVYLCLEALRAGMVAAENQTEQSDWWAHFQHHFLGPNELFIPVFAGFLFSFAYVSARNWQHSLQSTGQPKAPMPEEDGLSAKGLPPSNDVGNLPAAAGFFFVNTGHARKRIFYKDILYLKGEGNYVFYVTTSEKVLVRISMKEALQSLPPAEFAQIHRSYIVALQWIEKVENNHILIGAEHLAISASFREGFNQKISSL